MADMCKDVHDGVTKADHAWWCHAARLQEFLIKGRARVLSIRKAIGCVYSGSNVTMCTRTAAHAATQCSRFGRAPHL